MRVKTEARRQIIIDTAKKAFTEQGVKQTSMSYIAEKCGGSKATLYNYFSSKEDIFAAVMESSVTFDVASAFQKLSTETDLKTALFDFGFHYLQSVLSPELVAIRRMAMCDNSQSDISRYFYKNGPAKGQAIAAEYLSKQMEQGELIKSDPIVAAAQLNALLDAELLGPYEMNLIDKPDDEQLRQVVETAINSFLKIHQN
ncbi:TetR/AcrR family transcriptional regulator [Vibrio salinus]|uniref:TetR/AcrR family transcriptional regulator n=1 Tax=Vibrio salinus TaxID=2899784 RepID=UPI001E2BBB32|nr:TetR/AcrR family transcriptional regulator [Vibrio salinus]MCE0495377.1 TetR/AcrR family transcriptional regulator [Vibrio salinus]